MNLRTVLITTAALAVMTSGAMAQSAKVGQVSIEAPWARVTLQSRPAAAYMKIRNMGDAADSIVSASTPLAERVEMHTHTMTDGVMRMRQVDAIALPAKAHTELKPGGLHLMVFGLKRQIKKGEMIPIRLKLKHAGEVEVKAMVGTKPAAMDHSGHLQTE